ENRGEPELAAKLAQEIDDRALGQDVERGRRLVEDDDARVEQQGHRDQHALAHASGELVRISAQDPVRIEMDEVQELAGPVVDLVLVAHPMGTPSIEELLPDRDDRVERREGGLEDHGAVRPAKAPKPLRIERKDVECTLAVVVANLAFRDARAARRETDQADGECRFSRSRLADDCEGLALLKIEGHVAHRVDRTATGPVVDRQIANGKDRHGQLLRRGLNTSSSPDASQTSDSWKSAIAMIGPIR